MNDPLWFHSENYVWGSIGVGQTSKQAAFTNLGDLHGIQLCTKLSYPSN